MIHCGHCGRKMASPAGYVSGVGVGPKCLVALVGKVYAKPRIRPYKSVYMDQLELWEGEFYFLDRADADRARIEGI